jgi:hypothetical protein
MRLLVGIKSCVRDWRNGGHSAIRDTWGSLLPPDVDLRFFYGNGTGETPMPAYDEVHVDVGDNYLDLSQKTKAMCEWAVPQGYDFSYFADNDSFVHPERLMSCGFEAFDFSAPVHIANKPVADHMYPWGGFGYFVSLKVMQILSATPVESRYTAEDHWVGQILFENGFTLARVPKFSWHFPRDMYPSSVYNPKFPWQQMMMEYHLLKQPSPVRYWDTPIGRPVTYRKVPCTLNPGDKQE